MTILFPSLMGKLHWQMCDWQMLFNVIFCYLWALDGTIVHDGIMAYDGIKVHDWLWW